VQQSGYLVEHIEIDGNTAFVLADAPGLTWVELHLLRHPDGAWQLE